MIAANHSQTNPDSSDPLPLPLLITGVAGVAGYNAFHYFRSIFGDQVVGQRPVNNWPLNGAGIVSCDLEDRAGMRGLVQRYGFRSVLSCGGSCALKHCELDPAMAHRVNVVGLQSLLDALDLVENRLIHLSIDLVFSGLGGGGYVESDSPDPVTVYGKTMVRGEQMVLSQRPDACILRISLPMGVSFNGHAGAIDWIQSRFSKNKPATLYYDEIRTPTYVDCLNRLAHHLLRCKLAGLYHAGGPRCLSLYEIAQIVNRIGGYPPELLQGCFRGEAGPIPPRAGNVSMDSQLLQKALGFQPFDPWPLWKELVPQDRQWHCQRNTFQGSRRLLKQVLYEKPEKPQL